MTKTIESTLRSEFENLLDQSMLKITNCTSQLTDAQIWWRPAEGMNSIGNLLLHLRGNLDQWMRVGIQGDCDDRDRESEFSSRESASGQELVSNLHETVVQTKNILANMQSSDWLLETSVQGFSITKAGVLMHTVPHFVGHTHQIVMLTRMQLGDQYRFQWSPESDRDRVPI